MTDRTQLRCWLLTLAVLALSVAFACLSLINVPGATVRADGGCCDTEYERPWWSLAPVLLVVPIYYLGRMSSLWTNLAVVIAGVGTCFISYVGVTRIEDAGWGDGLERLDYVLSTLMVLMFIFAGKQGERSRRWARPRQQSVW